VFKIKVYLKDEIEKFGDIPSEIEQVTVDNFVSADLPLKSSFIYLYELDFKTAEEAFVKLNAIMMAGVAFSKSDLEVFYPTNMIGKIELTKSVIQTIF
jgi:hypothetical protein